MSTKPASLATLCCPTSSASPDTWSESCGDQRYSQLLPPTPSGRGQPPPGTCLWGQPGVVPFCFRSYSPERTRSSASSQEQGGEWARQVRLGIRGGTGHLLWSPRLATILLSDGCWSLKWGPYTRLFLLLMARTTWGSIFATAKQSCWCKRKKGNGGVSGLHVWAVVPVFTLSKP